MPDVIPEPVEAEKKIELQPIDDLAMTGLDVKAKVKNSKNKNKTLIIRIMIAAAAILLLGTVAWYNSHLAPLDKNGKPKAISIVSGSTPGQIGKQLQDEQIIKSANAFDIYVRLNRQGNFLQAGTYRLSSSESLQEIVSHLVKGSVDTVDIMFYPGATLVDNTSKASEKKLDVTSVLKRAGYSEQVISAALSKDYTGKLFDGRPSGADLEGYVYGETYKFNAGVTVEEILERAFNEFYARIEQNNLITKFSARDLTLFQAITLASIVQSEDADSATQAQVAQVFYSRIAKGMTLGSDVTYQYIADKTGVARDPNLDSPYNTRRFAGLPPGPISAPSISALKAVASPASGDYLFFLSGDDNKMYFAHTASEHEANIRDHCQIKCSTL